MEFYEQFIYLCFAFFFNFDNKKKKRPSSFFFFNSAQTNKTKLFIGIFLKLTRKEQTKNEYHSVDKRKDKMKSRIIYLMLL